MGDRGGSGEVRSPYPILLSFPAGCLEGRMIRRKNRFHVEVEVAGRVVGVHCNNSGSMLGLVRPGLPVWISPAGRPGRKLPYTLELVGLPFGWVGVNTLVPNRLFRAAWEAGLFPELKSYDTFQGEVRTGGSRLDAKLSGPCGRVWVEAKNVTLVEDDTACFPDAATERGRKHLRELMGLVRRGDRAACFYLVQRPDGHCFGPADFIDPDYARLFRRALEGGVEMWPYRALVSPRGIALGPRLPLAPEP